jgi:hypothetical protein
MRILPGVLMAAITAVAAPSQPAADQTAEPPLVARVSDYVEQYYSRARSILAEETVTLQPLTSSLTPEGFSRRLLYELRLDWDPAADPPATVLRHLVKAQGPPLGPPDQPDCPDPDGVSPEPLAFLLPEKREKYSFVEKGETRVKGRLAVTIDYTARTREDPVVKWEGDCGTFEVPSRLRGRLWIDPSSAAILRLDEHLIGPVDIPAPETRRRRPGPMWFTVDRLDTSIEFASVSFRDPDETLMLPSRVTALQVIRNSGLPRLRTTQSFANYRRFVTGSRIVK